MTAFLPYFKARSHLKPVNRSDLAAVKTPYTTIASQPDCPLLDKLPAELRNDIYRYILIEFDRIELHKVHAPALLATCRQIREEAGSLYFWENRFHVAIRIDRDIDSWKTGDWYEQSNRCYRVIVPSWIKAVRQQVRISDIRIEIPDTWNVWKAYMSHIWGTHISHDRSNDRPRITTAWNCGLNWNTEKKFLAKLLQDYLDELLRQKAMTKGASDSGLSFEDVMRIAAKLLPPSAGQMIAL